MNRWILLFAAGVLFGQPVFSEENWDVPSAPAEQATKPAQKEAPLVFPQQRPGQEPPQEIIPIPNVFDDEESEEEEVDVARQTPASTSAASDSTTAASLQMRMKKEGSENVLENLYSDSGWQVFSKSVVKGDASWVQVARQLRANCSAEKCMALDFLLGEALSRNPRAVLRGLDSDMVSAVCSTPDMDDARFANYEAARVAVMNRIHYVNQLKEHALARQKKECLIALRDSMKTISSFFKIKNQTKQSVSHDDYAAL